MRSSILLAIIAGALTVSISCGTDNRASRVQQPSAVASPSPEAQWSADLAQFLEHNPEVKRAWTEFERAQKYRLAQPSDRNLTAAAAARVESNQPNQIIPFLNWWGARGYEGKTDFLAVIVVDPSRTDPKRYGLVVFAAPKSEGPNFKPYWVLREQDLESYLLSGASGSFWVEGFERDGTKQTKELAWDKQSRRFRLI
jgi:hypothetical protein